MKSKRIIINPISKANEVRSQYNYDISAKVNLFQIIDNMNIRYRESFLGDKIMGACKAKGLHRLIVVDPNIEYNGRKRFTIAHELGHLIMHQGRHSCTDDMMNELKTSNMIETEANDFASELLLPNRALQEYLKIEDVTSKLVEKVSSQYETSLSAAAVALVKNCIDEVAIYYHNGERLEWKIRSKELKLTLEDCITGSDITKKSMKDGQATGEVDAEMWFKVNDEDMTCVEDTIYFTHLKKFMTIIRIER